MGPFNCIYCKTDAGMIGCGAFDVLALDKFNYPAAKIGSPDGSPLVTLDDLLDGAVISVNQSAAARGIVEGISGREAIAKL